MKKSVQSFCTLVALGTVGKRVWIDILENNLIFSGPVRPLHLVSLVIEKMKTYSTFFI